MAVSDTEQMGEQVRYKKRLAMGAKLDGSSMQARGQQKQSQSSSSRSNTSSGALARMKSK